MGRSSGSRGVNAVLRIAGRVEMYVGVQDSEWDKHTVSHITVHLKRYN